MRRRGPHSDLIVSEGGSTGQAESLHLLGIPPLSGAAVARTKYSPYGATRTEYVYDTSIREYVDRRTGEIASSADALRLPRGKRTEFTTGAISIRYKPEKIVPHQPLPQRFHGDHAIDIIRRQLSRAPNDARVVIRGKGGTEKYENEWWSSIPSEVEDLLGMTDDELADYLYGITDEGPEELDIYISEF